MEGRLAAFESAFVGRHCSVARRETDWAFSFGEAEWLNAECAWRLVTAKGIAMAGADDQQMFGLGAPFDVEASANTLLRGKSVLGATVDGITADLRIQFEGELRLELFNSSSGYEGWQAGFSHDGVRATLVALGGGGFQIF